MVTCTIPQTLIPAANVDYASISYSRKRNKSKNFTCILHKTTPTMYLNGYWCKSYYWINVLIKISNVSFKLQQLNCVIEFKKVSRKIHNTLHRWCALEWVVLLNVQCGEYMRIQTFHRQCKRRVKISLRLATLWY